MSSVSSTSSSSSSINSQITPENLAQGTFVRCAASPAPSPSPVLLLNMDDEKAVVRVTGSQTAEIAKSKIRLMLSPEDIVLARMPGDHQDRFFVAKIARKSHNEALTRLNSLKVLWQTIDDFGVVGFIPQHLRESPIIDRIIPLRHPNFLQKATSTSTLELPSGDKLMGYHFSADQ